MTERIAVTVIGGYLGAGKTTLVNHLLREADERIAVLVNDFGDINVDLDLIESRRDDTIELSNGCICCSIVDGFAAALDRIVALDPRPERLVIETSGVADPAQVAAYGHGPGLALDATIVLVDAETIRAAAEDKYLGQTVRLQLQAADVLVVNKADLVDQDDLTQTQAWLTEQCPEAFQMATSNAVVAAEVIFGRPRHARTAPEAQGHHHPEQVFSTETLVFETPLRRHDVDTLMDQMPDTTVRAKGLVWLEGADTPAVLQRVGRRWSLRPSTQGWSRDPTTEIVVISARVDAENDASSGDETST